MAGELHEVASARLARAEQRYTRSRRALVDLLAAAEAPLSLPQLLERGPHLAQSSAYRNLVVLERAGVVHRIVTADDFARYELAEDLTGHHHHLICTQCGEVRDFTVSGDVEADLGRALAEVAAAHGFTADHHRLDLVGRCDACR